MITNRSIDDLRDQLDIVDIIGKDVPLKKKGASHTGNCPFHNEKSPSFSVSKSKQIYKCFGCGAGGDVFKFVMQKENVDFFSAVRIIAARINFVLEERDETPEDKEEAAKKADFWKINTQAADKFQQALMDLPSDHAVPEELLNNRKWLPGTIVDFQLGFAPNVDRFLSEKLIDMGLFFPAEELGLVKSGEGRNYDVFRNRIIFPIHNERGQVVGFGGRKLEDKKKDNPKFINSKDSAIYKKESILYGLYQAQKAIKEMKYAVCVEGYADVLSFHQSGAPNTVAACGTAFTDGHAKLLKRFTSHVVLIGDGDYAGQQSNLKSVDVLLKHGFKVEICPLPEKEDPDSFARNHYLSTEEN